MSDNVAWNYETIKKKIGKDVEGSGRGRNLTTGIEKTRTNTR
jgi:hypothetical protein